MAVPNLTRNVAKPADQGKYYTTWGVTPAYQVVLDAVDHGGKPITDSSNKNIFPMIGNLPEKYDLSVGSAWGTPFAKSNDETLSSLGLGKAVGAVSSLGKALGYRANSKVMSAQVWESSEPLSFTFQFKFLTKTSAKTDVQERIIALMQLVMPSEDYKGTMLNAPGPTIAGALGSWISGSDTSTLSGRKITLYIGTFLILQNCIVKNVQVEVDNKLDEYGIPISATANVTFESFYSCFTLDDFKKMIVNK